MQAYARLAREHHPDLNGGSAPANRIWEGVALVERSEAGEPGARLSEAKICRALAGQGIELSWVSEDWLMIRRAYRILTDPEERVSYDSAVG